MSDLTIHHVPLDTRTRADEHKQTKKNGGFGALIKGAVNRLNKLEMEADQAAEQLAQDKTGIHETMITMQKADISMRLFLQIRNKALEAYKEIMRMPM